DTPTYANVAAAIAALDFLPKRSHTVCMLALSVKNLPCSHCSYDVRQSPISSCFHMAIIIWDRHSIPIPIDPRPLGMVVMF
ncbi:MAG: hypothetical protein ACI8P9_005414, partial [Parasphingorhabdus sp.]